MKTKYKYIHFEKNPAKQKPDGWVCKNKRSKHVLGWIDYDNQWCQYIFLPASHTQFSADCFEDIVDFMKNQLP